jgi:hypothetical protein
MLALQAIANGLVEGLSNTPTPSHVRWRRPRGLCVGARARLWRTSARSRRILHQPHTTQQSAR